MSHPALELAGEEITLDAPVEVVLDLVRDPDPLHYLSSTIVYTERAVTSPHEDVLTVWFIEPDETVWSRTQRRVVEPDGRRVTFTEEPGSALAGLRGEWLIDALPDGTTRVELHQDLDGLLDPSAAARAEASRLDLLDTTAYAVTHRAVLDDLVVDFRDPLFVAGAAADAYAILDEADRWPERLAHVSRIDMTTPQPGVQFFDMDTTTGDGRAHTTRSVRLCFPHHKIMYKQIGLPALLDAHTGHWLFTETRDGLIVESRHVAVIKESALSILGEGTTVADARRYLRRILSANSMTNLRLAKEHAENAGRA